MSRGIHTKPNNGQSVDWLTPPVIIKALGRFDLDPCAHPNQPWKTAKRMISPPADGLTYAWKGRVWLNPPYGTDASHEWLGRMAEHGNGIALIASRTETRWFHEHVWDAASSCLFLYGRLYYHRPDGTRAGGNAGHGLVLVAYGSENTDRLLSSGIAGKPIVLHK